MYLISENFKMFKLELLKLYYFFGFNFKTLNTDVSVEK